MKHCIVVGNDHYNTLNVIRALGKAGIKTDLILITDDPKPFVNKSKYLSSSTILNQTDQIINLLSSKQYTALSKPFLLPTFDEAAAIIDDNLNSLSPNFIIPSVAHTQGMLYKWMDKDIQLRHAEKSGFDIPYSISFDLSNFSSLPSTITFPCIIKPEVSADGSKKDMRICHNPSQIKDALNLAKKNGNKKVLIQEFIPNNSVYLVMGVRNLDGTIHIFNTVEKIKYGHSPHNLGLHSLATLSDCRRLQKICADYVESLDYYGIFSIEVVSDSHSYHDSQKNYFLEINLRTDGCIYLYTAHGINFPQIWVNQLSDCSQTKRNKTIGMNEIFYLKNFFSPKKLLTTLKDIANANTFAYFSLKDPKPFFAKILGKF